MAAFLCKLDGCKCPFPHPASLTFFQKYTRTLYSAIFHNLNSWFSKSRRFGTFFNKYQLITLSGSHSHDDMFAIWRGQITGQWTARPFFSNTTKAKASSSLYRLDSANLTIPAVLLDHEHYTRKCHGTSGDSSIIQERRSRLDIPGMDACFHTTRT
jgi:hypothetical protein